MADGAGGDSAEYRNVFGVRLQQPCDMPDDVLRFSIDCARKNLAATADWQTDGDACVQAMKAELDAAYGPQFHVFVGKKFGSRVTHEAKHFTFFYLGDKAVLIFKAG